MKVAVVGSRGYPQGHLVRALVRRLAQLDPDTVIVSGGAQGVDSWAEDEAKKCGLGTVVLKADWGRYGKQAGFLRNTEIVEQGDIVIAFWDLTSSGTRDTIGKARIAGKEVRVLGPEGKILE